MKKILNFILICTGIAIGSFIGVFLFNIFNEIFFTQNQKFIETLIGGFSGAFFAFLFIRLSEGLKTLYNRHVKYYNALVRLEIILNQNYIKFAHNKAIIEEFESALIESKKIKKIIVVYNYFEPFKILNNLISHLLGQEIINLMFIFNQNLLKINTDFFTINRLYEKLATRSLNINDLESYIYNLDPLVKVLQLHKKFIENLQDENIKLSAKIVVLAKEHKPIFTKLMFLILPAKPPFRFNKKVIEQEAKIREELKESLNQSKIQVETLKTF